MTNITITAADKTGSFSVYTAAPKSSTGPAVVVIQEIFGVNYNVRSICDWLADEGFFAFAPDLFWRQKPGIELEAKNPEELQAAFGYMKAFDGQKGLDDIQTTINHARSVSGVNGKVGAVGYCLGGYLAYMTAAKTDIDASVGYYGVSLDTKIDEAKTIKKPLMLHIAEKDGFVSPEAQAAMHKGLDDHPAVTLYDYAGVDHGFARIEGSAYHKEAATLANKRTIDFFNKHLKGA
ncbi:dienelactone hydrolase family protein [Kordiimonas pumila]|uniref:Dienelactone hydrolase family protein n=1 Tax=Kordiimonas pumila TaxID=2161677 RepID=A0ABV7D8X6_9PROT|nr:dienelactone hydrolase family protein [Kordiimonas pumila]